MMKHSKLIFLQPGLLESAHCATMTANYFLIPILIETSGRLKVLTLVFTIIPLCEWFDIYLISNIIVYKATGSISIEGIKNFEVFTTSPGLFDQCLSVDSTLSFQGQFCSVFFKQEPSPDSSNKEATNNEQDGDGGTFRLPRVGFCIPSSCSPRDFRSSIAQLVARHQHHNNNISLTIITISDENYCYTKNKIASSAQALEGAD